MSIIKKAALIPAFLLISILVLSACGSKNEQPASSSAVSKSTQEKSSEVPTVTPSVTETPEAEQPKTIWDILGSDARTFADSFSSDRCDSLEYVFYSEGGANVVTTADKALIQDVFDALCGIEVLQETDIMADDFDDVFRFYSGDEAFMIRFNMHHLDAGGTYYLLENDEALWQAANIIADNEPEESEEPVFITAVCESMNFSFEYSSVYEAEEDESGRISVYLHSGINSHPYIRVGRLKDDIDAEGYLANISEEISSSFDIQASEDSGQTELTQIDDRDLYTCREEFSMDDLPMVFVGYAEDYQDGSIVYYYALFENKYEPAASEALMTAIQTIWVGELDDSPVKPDEPEKHTAGRWTYTETPLASGDIEYCFDDALILTIPASWVDKVIWSCEDDSFNFYHTDSYNKLAAKGLRGGLLFSLAYYTDDSYEYLPSYRYLGLAEGGSYVMIFPTDVQAYEEDEDVLNEWQELFNSISYILDNSYSMIFQ